jgi:hypothetical protein
MDSIGRCISCYFFYAIRYTLPLIQVHIAGTHFYIRFIEWIDVRRRISWAYEAGGVSLAAVLCAPDASFNHS